MGYETSVRNYHSTLRNAPEEHRSHQHRGGSMKELIASENCLSDCWEVKENVQGNSPANRIPEDSIWTGRDEVTGYSA